ncbi:PREDICTED: mucosal pentraxin-like [Chinchilla lanigera]|nr:PREDICTED: mucosal pentraxin-like [Chinchilla lanigera]
MEKLLLGTLLLSILSASVTQSDVKRKVLIFPQESATAYVSLIPAVRKPLQSFTLCLKSFTDLTRPYSLFSYNTRSQDNELLLFIEKTGEYQLYIGNSRVSFNGPSSPYNPRHICVSWESASGIAEFWVDGKPLGRKGIRKGYTVGADAKIILGQEQDSFGGNFDAKQSFVGEIWDLSLWDRVLPLKDMCGCCDGGNVLDWKTLQYEENGYVVTKPSLWA